MYNAKGDDAVRRTGENKIGIQAEARLIFRIIAEIRRLMN